MINVTVEAIISGSGAASISAAIGLGFIAIAAWGFVDLMVGGSRPNNQSEAK